jgi:hypothetical protein
MSYSRKEITDKKGIDETAFQDIDEAVRDMDAGKGVPMNEVRNRVASWASE